MPATSVLAPGLAPEENVQFAAFLQLCNGKGALTRPEGLAIDDCDHGILDPPTLLYASLPLPCRFRTLTDLFLRRFLTARQFECDAALNQFQSANKFRSEKQVVHLFDTIEVSEFEQVRQLVRRSRPLVFT